MLLHLSHHHHHHCYHSFRHLKCTIKYILTLVSYTKCQNSDREREREKKFKSLGGLVRKTKEHIETHTN